MYVVPSNPSNRNYGDFSNVTPSLPQIDTQINQYNSVKPIMTPEDEMELYGIENNCIRVTADYMNGGYKCDDFD